jgi:methyl-accepting chemotaxis protein
MFRRGLKSKILNLTVGLSLLGFGVLVFLVIQEEEKSLLRERLNASELMAKPILHTIYTDMLEERADMPRFLIEGLKTMEGVERVQLIRSNGVEEAFQDYKTLDDVREEFGEIKDEWLVDHPRRLNNVALGIQNLDFKKALTSFNAGSKEASWYIERHGNRSFFTYLVPIESRPKCNSCHAREEEARGVLMISTSLDEMYGVLAGSRNKWVMYGIITVSAMTLLLWLLVRGLITRPVDRTVEMLKGIADGRGDLTRRLEVTSDDEIGMLGSSFNRFVEGMQYLVKDIIGVSRGVSKASRETGASSAEIIGAVGRQLKAVDETFGAIKEMDASIKTVAEDAEVLSMSTVSVSGSSRAMSVSVDEVKANIEKLFHSGSSTASSIKHIVVSINQVASHVEELFSRTEEIVSSIADIGSRVKLVESYSRTQAELAEKVREDAEDLGLASVVKTREGIEKLNTELHSASDVVNRLGERSIEIGRILTVINDIADTTQLLALNATILAAQAGEHGKGFGVVARQIKDLATKTTASTKEISGLITHVQSESSTAVDSMRRSLEKARDGVSLSRDAQKALMQILDSAKRSFEKAKMIERVTVDQTKGVGQISSVAQVISAMVGEIKTASGEQSTAADEIMKDTVLMKESMERVRKSTIEQSRESRQVTEAIFRVVEKIDRVAASTSDQEMLSRRMVAAIETVRAAAEDSAHAAAMLEETVRAMNEQADALKSAVGSFKT